MFTLIYRMYAVRQPQPQSLPFSSSLDSCFNHRCHMYVFLSNNNNPLRDIIAVKLMLAFMMPLSHNDSFQADYHT